MEKVGTPKYVLRVAVRYNDDHVHVRGAKVRVLTGGTGPPLLVLGDAEGASWNPLLERLSELHTVYHPEHPGFGQSDEGEGIDTVHDLAFFHLDLLSELGLESVSIVGFSLGGWIAADLAAIEPDRVERLVLVGPMGLRVDGVTQPDVFMLSAGQVAELTYLRRDLYERAAAEITTREADPEALSVYLRNRVAVAHLAWNPYFHDPKLPLRAHRARMPTLLIWGTEDRIVPPEHGRRWAELLPDARLELIADAGHLPHVEQPERFLSRLMPFLSDGAAG